MGAREAGRRSSRVAQVVRSELATVLRQDSVRGPKRCPGKVRQMISLVDIDVSPDLRNARVKFSVLGDRQDKVTATRWVLGNAGGIRMALAGRLRQMKRVPALNFQHVDVGKAVDVMVLLDQLSNERLGGGGGGGGTGDDLDFEASEDDAFGDGEGEAELTADEAAFLRHHGVGGRALRRRGRGRRRRLRPRGVWPRGREVAAMCRAVNVSRGLGMHFAPTTRPTFTWHGEPSSCAPRRSSDSLAHAT